MLPSKKRLSRHEFTKFLAQGGSKTVFNSLGTLKFKEAETNQVSVVISLKVEKRSVYRNKLRRRLYSIFAEYFRKDPETKHLILYVSKQAVNIKYQDLKIQLDELFRKITK
ncbi:MAG: ribonuclease P protein component [Patescibacteria group bacterium]